MRRQLSQSCAAFAIGVAMAASAVPARAQTASLPREAEPPRGWRLQAAVEALREAWNYNESDEDLFGGSLGLLYRFGPRWSAGFETLLLWVSQEEAPNTMLVGFSPVARWQGPWEGLSVFAEGGVGISYAAHPVPRRGTRFNYLAHVGGGLVHPAGRRAEASASLRWLHLSNNGLAGRGRNPDIQALGIRLGLLLTP